MVEAAFQAAEAQVIRTAICEHVERRKADPEFQKLLKRNMERHAQLLSMLAGG